MRSSAPAALMVVIFYLSSQSDPGADIGPVLRVFAHAGEFAALASLWAWALAPAAGRRAVAAAAAIALAYAITDEIHQSSVPGRDADPLDVVADAAGIAVASWLMLRIWQRPAR